MTRHLILAFCAVALFLACDAGAATAEEGFGLKDLDITFTDPSGAPDMRAGSHPFEFTTTFSTNTKQDPKIGAVPIDAIKDLQVEMPAGFVGDPRATPRCSAEEFAETEASLPACSDSTVVGVATVSIALSLKEGAEPYTLPIYNLVPPPGAPAKFGFIALTVPVTLVARVNPAPPYNLIASVTNSPQPLRVYGAKFTLWGNPASALHDEERGFCAGPGTSQKCPASVAERPFLTMPRRCEEALRTTFEVDSWQEPGRWLPYVIDTHDNTEPPQPLGTTDCASLGLKLKDLSSKPTSDQAESPTGLDFNLDIADEGLISPSGRAQSDIKKVVVTLPKGVTANPSAAEGLRTCSEADLDRETVNSEPGEGCPQASKVGTVEVETPLLEGSLIKGQVFVATQKDNPFGGLLALYMVIKDKDLGILVKLPGKVEPDPQTGQLVTTFGQAPYELPQFPFSHFRFHFREGGRSLLITPPGCGKYTTKAVMTPWANPGTTYTFTDDFEIKKGVGGGPCPAGGAPPFNPGFSAGTTNNDAGSYSPFVMRLTRADGDQDMTRFSSVLPPGVTGKIAGVAKCPDLAIVLAAGKSGRAEQASPSCPAGSQIGSVLAGAGVGSQLTYVPGQIYLAGPYKGAPLSVAVITPAVAGPFDVGTVVVREGLKLNPVSAEVEVDGAASDPIPHILAGIPLKLRDLRVFVDRQNFTLNATSCEPSSARATLFGSAADVFNPADDVPVALSDRYQAANCASLGFKPKLDLKLSGGTRRNTYPALRAVLTYPKQGHYANIRRAVVVLPRSAFIEQGHFETICTRVQFAADACPPNSIYGKAAAFTPLLDEPLRGPVYLRANGGERDLPDLVADLHGLVDIELVGYVDSVNSRLRSTFATTPDAPVSKFVLEMQGGKKGLFVNSVNLCAHRDHAKVSFTGQNGMKRALNPVVRNSCKRQR